MSEPRLIRREDQERFWALVQQYEELPQETKERVGFLQFCEVQADIAEAEERAEAWAMAAAEADTHSSDVEPRQ